MIDIGKLKDMFSRLFSGDSRPVSEGLTVEDFDLCADSAVRDLAFMTCVNFTANSISKCEFKTLKGGQEVRGAEWYLWNVEPNQNENSSVFLHRLIHHLYRDNEALVIESKGKLFVADSFCRTEYALYEDVFSNVTVGTFTFARTFVQSEVMYFRLHDTNINQILKFAYNGYGKLLTYAMQAYQKSRGTKGKLVLDMQMARDPAWKRQFEDLKNTQFKRFAEADNAVLPLYKGMDFQELSHKTYTSDSTRDVRALVDDITDFTARAFGIPPSILNGTVQDVTAAVAQAMAFCIDPLADLLQEEINRKRYGQAAVLRGDCLRIDTGTMKHYDVLDISDSADKLIAAGVMSVNDVRALAGLPLIPDSWAWEHVMTKNYGEIEQTGGETDEVLEPDADGQGS